MPEFSIIVSERGGAENRTPFSTEDVGIGRVQGNELVLPKGNVSKRHARISYVEGRFVVADLNSTNGTYVNRRRISQSTIVRFGDRIYIGDFVLRIEDPSAPYETASERVRDLQESVPDFSDQTAKTNALLIPSSTAHVVPPAPVQVAPEETGPAASGSVSTGEFDAVSAEDGSREFGPGAHQVLRELLRRAEQKVEPKVLASELSEALRRRVETTVSELWAKLEKEGTVESRSPYQDILQTRAVSELVEFGPLGQLFSDPSVTQIVASGADSLVVWRGDLRRHEVPFSSAESLLRVVTRLCQRAGTPIRSDERVVERSLSGPIRLSCGVTQDGARVSTLRIWRETHRQRTFDDLVHDGALSRGMATFLRQAVVHRANVLVVGAAKGVERLLGAATDVAYGQCIVLHGGSALGEGRPDAIRLDWSLEGARESVPRLAGIDGVRLIVSDWVPASVDAVFGAVASGVQGVLVGATSRSFSKWWSRASSELTATSKGLDVRTAERWLGAAFDFVVEVAELADERLRVLKVLELTSNPDGTTAFTELFLFDVEREASGGGVEGTFRPTGTVPDWFTELRARGFAVDLAVFRTAR